MRSYPCKVVGITHEGRLPYILSEVREGDSLSLQPEPDNEFDDKAVAVLHEGRKIGYIPAGKRWVSKSIEEGDTHEVVAVGLIMNDEGEPAAIAITITIMSDGAADPMPSKPDIRILPAKKSSGSGRGLAFFALFAIVILGVLANLPKNLSTVASADGICSKLKAGQAQDIVTTWTDAGVIVGHREGVVVVSDKRWAKIKNDARVSIGIAEFCRANSNSRGVLLVRGEMDNADLGSMVDGNWFR